MVAEPRWRERAITADFWRLPPDVRCRVRLHLLVPNDAARSHNLIAFLTDGYGRTLNAR